MITYCDGRIDSAIMTILSHTRLASLVQPPMLADFTGGIRGLYGERGVIIRMRTHNIADAMYVGRVVASLVPAGYTVTIVQPVARRANRQHGRLLASANS